jgi:DNA-binding transcriptional ArsR family regulator
MTMGNLSNQRQGLILKWLQEKQSLTIQELSQHFGVSTMTIHRDLDTLVEAGFVEKVHGGVTLISEPEIKDNTRFCRMCAMPITPRTMVIIHLISGEILRACCPHCGLLLMKELAIKSALTPDFIYGRMTNMLQAFYVIESRILLCCSPSVLCFTLYEDALSFQVGFGGQIVGYPEALDLMSDKHEQNSSL